MRNLVLLIVVVFAMMAGCSEAEKPFGYRRGDWAKIVRTDEVVQVVNQGYTYPGSFRNRVKIIKDDRSTEWIDVIELTEAESPFN